MSKRDPTWISEWNPEDEKFWKSKGKAIAQRNLIWSIVAEHLGFSIWLIWSIVATKLPQAGFHYTTDQLFQLVALARTDRLADAVSLHVCGHDVWRPQLDDLQRGGAVHPDARPRLFRDPARHSVLADAAGGGNGRPRRRQLRLEHGQYFLLLPGPHQGLGARLERGWRKYRRERRAVAHPAPAGVRLYQSLPGDPDRGRPLSPERRADVATAARRSR